MLKEALLISLKLSSIYIVPNPITWGIIDVIETKMKDEENK